MAWWNRIPLMDPIPIAMVDPMLIVYLLPMMDPIPI